MLYRSDTKAPLSVVSNRYHTVHRGLALQQTYEAQAPYGTSKLRPAKYGKEACFDDEIESIQAEEPNYPHQLRHDE